jgi:hypothetical protein
VDGPLEVLGQGESAAQGTQSKGQRGGVMHEDLQQAFYEALAIPRNEARNRALEFSWSRATQLFLSHLVPVRGGAARSFSATAQQTRSADVVS